MSNSKDINKSLLSITNDHITKSKSLIRLIARMQNEHTDENPIYISVVPNFQSNNPFLFLFASGTYEVFDVNNIQPCIDKFVCISYIGLDSGQYNDLKSVTETFCISVDKLEKVNVRTVTYEDMCLAQALDYDNLSVMQDAFKKYYPSASYDDYKEYSSDRLKFPIIWKDVYMDNKYGTVIVKIMFDNNFIGWVKISGKYLEEFDYYCLNVDLWHKMMEHIFAVFRATFEHFEEINMVDIDDFDFDEHVKIEGISTKEWDTK